MNNKRRIIGIQFFMVDRVIEDMLRHDTAFAADRFPGIVAYPRFRDLHGALGGNRIHAVWGGIPTVDKWKSFGVSITMMTDEQIRRAGIHVFEDGIYDHAWYTFIESNRVSLYDYVNDKKKKGES